MYNKVKTLSFLLCFCLLLISDAFSQSQVSFTIQAPREVYASEPFDISFVINSEGAKNFHAPDFKGFDVLFGPSQSQSSSYQVINGKHSQNFSLSFSYRIRAPKEGIYNLGSASININNNQYSTESINIKALPPRSSSSSSGQSTNSQQNSGIDSKDIDGNDVFLRCIVDKKNPFIGEQVTVTYRIYTAVQIRQYSVSKLPSNKGFWTEELTVPENEHSETIDGKRYVYVDLRKVALFPQEVGKLTLEPLEMDIIAAVIQRKERSRGNIFDFFDDPFFDQVSYVKSSIKSNSISINVKPLPVNGKPDNFNGLVGNFDISFDHNKDKETRANDAITFTLNVNGNGNIALFQTPNIVFPPDFEVYEPNMSFIKNKSSDRVGGKTSIEYIAVPRNPGIYRIPSFELSFFKPNTQKYETITIDEIVLNVKEGNGTVYQGRNDGSPTASKDILSIQTHLPDFGISGRSFFLSAYWWIIFCLIPILFILAIFLYHRYKEKQKDVIGLLNKGALKEAKRCLKKANSFMVQHKKDDFFIEISQALWGFISHKFNIPVADLSIKNVENKLSENGISSDCIASFIKTLNRCEFERFAPQGNSEQNIESLYQEALGVISQIVKELK